MSSNTTPTWEAGPDSHLVYLRPGVGEETTLDVLNIPHGSTTVSIPQPEPQLTAARFVPVSK